MKTENRSNSNFRASTCLALPKKCRKKNPESKLQTPPWLCSAMATAFKEKRLCWPGHTPLARKVRCRLSAWGNPWRHQEWVTPPTWRWLSGSRGTRMKSCWQWHKYTYRLEKLFLLSSTCSYRRRQRASWISSSRVKCSRNVPAQPRRPSQSVCVSLRLRSNQVSSIPMIRLFW